MNLQILWAKSWQCRSPIVFVWSSRFRQTRTALTLATQASTSLSNGKNQIATQRTILACREIQIRGGTDHFFSPSVSSYFPCRRPCPSPKIHPVDLGERCKPSQCAWEVPDRQVSFLLVPKTVQTSPRRTTFPQKHFSWILTIIDFKFCWDKEIDVERNATAVGVNSKICSTNLNVIIPKLHARRANKTRLRWWDRTKNRD